MDRVSTSGLYGSVLANLTAAQNAQVSAATQISSGKKASDLKGFGGASETLTAMQSVQSQTTSFLDQSNLLANKLTMQDTAMTQLGTAAQSASKAISDALASGDGTALMQTLTGNFQDAISALVNLGYGRPQAAAAIAASLEALGEAAEASALIRRGLKELAQ